METERTMDQVLADSFPASDPPPWTLGVALPHPARHGIAGTLSTSGDLAHDGSRRSRPKRTLGQGFRSLAGAIGIALLFPVAILIVGVPIALAVRLVAEAVAWLTALALS